MKDGCNHPGVAVSLKNLSVGYTVKDRKIVIADNIDETVEAGTMVCLIGPNGGGKSTLLKTLCGFLPPLKGFVGINGEDVMLKNRRQLARIIGVVLTERGLFTNMTGRELVALGRAPHTGFFGTLRADDNEAVNNAIEAVGAGELADREVATLSDGERQKLLIAKTLAQDTPVIILDEPTAFLDYPSKVEIMRLLKNLSRRKDKIVFISTHDLDIAFAITDYLWIIDKKLGFETGTLDQLGSRGTIDRYFHSDGLKFDNSTRQFTITA